MRPLQTFAAATLLISAAACSAAEPRSDAGPRPAEMRTVVDVRNHHWSDMVIYAVQSDHRQRLGLVNSMSAARLTFPPALDGAGTKVRLLADPIGGNEQFSTDPIRVSPGQRVEFTIENHLAISNYAVWNR
jgi:hypothetical protein